MDRENTYKDTEIYNLVLSWRPLTRLILMLFAVISIRPIALFIFKLIRDIENTIGFYRAAYYINSGFYYFSFINIRFGGLILLIFFLAWKKGSVADILLASISPEIKISNVFFRTVVYITAIIGFAFIYAKILFVTASKPFIYPTGIRDIYDSLVVAISSPISEEIYYRFLILYIVAAIFGRIPAIFISTFFFTISHDLSQPYYNILFVTILGFVNSLSVISFGTLWPAIGIHIINNTLAY